MEAAMLRTVQFQCPNCGALYQVIKCEAGPETDDRRITCRACAAPLVGRDGQFVLKYFLLRPPRSDGPQRMKSGQQLRPLQPPARADYGVTTVRTAAVPATTANTSANSTSIFFMTPPPLQRPHHTGAATPSP
jgi:hypothetical protein